MGVDRTGSVSTLQICSITDQGDGGEIGECQVLLFLLLVPGEKTQCGSPIAFDRPIRSVSVQVVEPEIKQVQRCGKGDHGMFLFLLRFFLACALLWKHVHAGTRAHERGKTQEKTSFPALSFLRRSYRKPYCPVRKRSSRLNRNMLRTSDAAYRWKRFPNICYTVRERLFDSTRQRRE